MHQSEYLLNPNPQVIAPDFILLFVAAQKVSKKARCHKAPLFSGLVAGIINDLIFYLASGWLLGSPLIFAWFLSLLSSGISVFSLL